MSGSAPPNSRTIKTPPIPSSPRSAPPGKATNQSAVPSTTFVLQPVKDASPPSPTNQGATNGSEHSLLDFGCEQSGAAPNGHQPTGELHGDDVSLLSALSGPSSHDSLLSDGRSDEGQVRAAGEPAATGKLLSLADVTVPLEDIKPGGGPPVPLFSEPASLEIALHPAGNRPRPDVTVYVITALNRTGRPVSQYTLQAVCDKGARVRLQPPSSADLPAGSPFLPPPAASQVMLLANPQQLKVTLRFMLSYSVDGDTVTEMADVADPGRP
ncbi:ADP-ribosylation factor-binding protein GGA1-like [Pollicipes pollicipes]|uniref:ADP-ribosylation factor-binding protein GGA1-like n=1 Tax=Pollicipes pollicipes TaxID=41117 RepID=UPI001884E689|nr:ADP-ribosylation factor-binding protein GGA1-like [Pollicipes pollicipes]